MKKLCLMILAAVLVLTMTAPAVADVPDATRLPACYRYVTVGEAIMYKASDMPAFEDASAVSTVIGRVYAGETVNVMALSAYRDWAFVTTSSLPGGAWIPSNVLINASVAEYNAMVVAGSSGLRVNLRQGPDSASTTLGKYYTGTLVTVLDETPAASGYYRVRVGAVEGYMDGVRLERSMTNAWTELPVLVAGSWTAAQHPLHEQPNSGSQILGYVPSASSVTVLGIRSDGWYHIMYQGVIGYIRSNALLQTLPWDLDAVNTSSGIINDPAGHMIDKLLNTDNRMFVLSSAPGRRVNLRNKPSASAVSLIKYYTGTPVYVIDSGENGYLHVRIGYMEGYMDVNFLSPDPYARSTDMHGSAVKTEEGYGYVYQWNENESPATAMLPNGTDVVVIGFSDDWAHIVYGDMQHGYMHRTDLYPAP